MKKKPDLILTIELVPENTWFTNLRSILLKENWDFIRRECYRNADYKCQICGNKGKKWPVECHEIWEYDDTNKIQKLTGVIALCPDCHQVKHIGLAQIKGKYKQAINHFCKVNKTTQEFAEEYIEQCAKLLRKRNKYTWVVNIDWVGNNLTKTKEN